MYLYIVLFCLSISRNDNISITLPATIRSKPKYDNENINIIATGINKAVVQNTVKTCRTT